MPLRSFTDDNDVTWQVWDVRPSQPDLIERRKIRAEPPSGAEERRAGAGLATGWLAFESEHTRRRLAPIPPEWQDASEEQLRAWCAEARILARRAEWMKPDPQNPA
jgi:hypothetical protein